LWAQSPDTTHARLPAPADSVQYAAETIEYVNPEHLLMLDGNAMIRYRTAKLKADHIRYNTQTQDLMAWGVPVLWDGDQKVVGDRLIYNVGSGRGTIFQGFSVTEFNRGKKGMFSGVRIHKVGPSTMNVVDGSFTTCDAKCPHYYFTSHKIKLYHRDRAIAKPIYLKFRDVPVFVLPYAIFPIQRKNRQSGLIVPTFGEQGFLQADSERYIEDLGYYFALSDYHDLALYFSYGERRGWWWEANWRYNLRYVFNGTIRYEQRHIPISGGKRKEWQARWNHNQQIDETASLRANVNLSSSQNFYSNSLDFDEQPTRSIRSTITLQKQWTFGSGSVALEETRTFDTDETGKEIETQNQRLPVINFSMRYPTLPLFPFVPEETYWEGISLNPSSRFNAQRTKTTGSPEQTDITTSHSLGISLPALDLFPLSFNPSIRYSETWNKMKYEVSGRHKSATLSASISARTKIIGLFQPGIAGIEMLRHTINPTISYSYSPFRRIHSDGTIFPLMNWDYDVERSDPSKELPISVQHIFDLKWRRDSHLTEIDSVGIDTTASFQGSLSPSSSAPKEKKIQLARLNFSTRYNFGRVSHPWADLNSSLQMNPLDAFQVQLGDTKLNRFSLNWNTRHDTQTWELQSVSFDASASIGGKIGSALPDSTASSTAQWTWFDLDTLTVSHNRPLAEEISFGTRHPERLSGKRDWSFSATWRYESSAGGGKRITGRFRFDFKPTAKWQVTYHNSYDFQDQTIRSQSFNFTRDLHCWQATFSWNMRPGYWDYRFRFSIIDLPDIQIEQDQREFRR